MSTHVERNHVVHEAGNSARDCSDIERYRKTRPPTSCRQDSGIESWYVCQGAESCKLAILRQSKFDWSIDRSRPCLGLRDGNWLFKIVWKWRLPHAVTRACLKGKNPAIQSSLMPRSLSPLLSALSDVIVTKTGSKVWEKRARDEKSISWKRFGETSRWVIPSATSLSKCIESNSDLLTLAAAFEKCWDNNTNSCKWSSAVFMPWSTLPGSSEMSIAYSDSGCVTVGDGIKRFRGGWRCMLWAGRGHE